MVENSICFIVEMINYLYILCLIRKNKTIANRTQRFLRRCLVTVVQKPFIQHFLFYYTLRKIFEYVSVSDIILSTGNITVNNNEILYLK